MADKKLGKPVKFEVMKSVRAFVEEQAKSNCEEREIEYKEFNQDMCAWTAYRALKDKGADFTKVGKSDEERIQIVFGILKVCANASALKQAITGERQKGGSTVDVDPSLL